MSFFISDTNPNDNCGGGGCACSPEKVSDCAGPYAIFTGVDTDWHLSPNFVIGARCLRAAASGLDGEVLSAGERGPEHVVQGELVDEDEIPEV